MGEDTANIREMSNEQIGTRVRGGIIGVRVEIGLARAISQHDVV